MPSSSRKKKLLVFLSHAKEDKAKVRKLCQQLKEDGFNPWLDEEKILPGHDRRLEIEKAQRVSDAIILCFSEKSIGKEGYVQREYKQAMDISKEKPEGVIFVIPVRLDKCDVPFFLKDLQWVDYPSNYERLLLSLGTKSTSGRLLKPSKVKKAITRNKILRTTETEDTASPVINISYRQEVLAEFFKFVKRGESFYLLGGSGFGKKRLFDFVLRRDVLSRYIGASAEDTWILKVNPYLLETVKNVWAFYELLFRSLLLELNTHENASNFVEEVVQLDAQIIERKDDLLASRFFGLAVNKFCQRYNKNLCFLFDEFDEAYRSLPRELFSELRAIREENRGKLSYVFFLRNTPEMLRPPNDVWAIYELFSQNVIGIGPYTGADTFAFIQQLEERYEHRLTIEKGKVYLASGGHAGLIAAIFKILSENPIAKDEFSKPNWLDWLSQQHVVLAECDNILASLDEVERQTLLSISQNEINKTSILVTRVLALKGMLRIEENKIGIFSPILKNYLSSMKK